MTSRSLADSTADRRHDLILGLEQPARTPRPGWR
jgi:hypothetical protein